MVARLLRVSGSLRTLWLNDNCIGDEGAKALSAGVASSGSLVNLFLANNRIGDEGAKALVAGVASGSLALKTLIVDFRVKKHAELVAACKSKHVELRSF